MSTTGTVWAGHPGYPEASLGATCGGDEKKGRRMSNRGAVGRWTSLKLGALTKKREPHPSPPLKGRGKRRRPVGGHPGYPEASLGATGGGEVGGAVMGGSAVVGRNFFGGG